MNVQIHERLLRLNESIQQASEKAQRSLDEIRLVAISKTKPADAIRGAFKAGQLTFGENRVQEAIEKIDDLHDLSQLEWHLVGHLQKNKARFCPGRFQWIHSLESLELAKRLERLCQEQKTSIKVLIQLNLSEEDSKSGLGDWEQLMPLAEEIMKMEMLELRGLMTMPAPNQGEAETRKVFAQLREMQQRLQSSLDAPKIDQLSMGMTSDYEWAILEGATMIRVGSAIFGPRH